MEKLTQDEINAALSQAGLKPGMGTVELHDDDTVSVRPLPTEDRGALEVLGRRLAGGLPKAAGAAAAMGLGSGPIASAGAGGGVLGGAVAGPIGAGVGTFGGAALMAAGLGGAGSEAAGALDDKTLKIRQQMLGNRAQQIRDETQHPWATTAGDFGADLMAFGPPSRALASGAAKLGTAARWARGAMNFAPEESQALVSHGANALLGAGQSAAQQYSDSGTVDPMATLKAGAEGALLGNPGDTIKGLRGLRSKPSVATPSVQSPSSPPAPTTADAPWTERVSAGQDMAPAELDLNVNNDRVKGTLAGKIADVRDQRREGDVKIAQQAFKAKEQVLADQGEAVRQRLLAELEAQAPDMDPKDAAVQRTQIMKLTAADLGQFHGDIAAGEKAQADERLEKSLAPTTADLEQATIRKNIQNWKRPSIPLAAADLGPRPVATVATPEEIAAARSTADPIRENTANELRQALIGGQITGSPVTPRPQKTRFSRPEDVGPDRGLPTEGPRTEAETLQDYLENRRTKFQTRPKSEAADAPTPEPAGVLAEAVRLAADPKAGKKAAFIPAGSPRPEVPAGMVSLAHPKGEFVYNPQKMTPEEAARAVAGDQLDGQALGLGQKTKPTAPSDHSVVTDSNGQPAVMTEVVAGPQDVARAKAAQQNAAPGSTQRVVLTADVLAGREAGLAPSTTQPRLVSDTPTRKVYEIKGGRGEVAARFDVTLDDNGVWRPTTGSGFEIFDKKLRGKGIGEKFVRKFSDEVGPIGSTGLNPEHGTSDDALKMWKRIGAPVENLPNTHADIGEKQAYVLRKNVGLAPASPLPAAALRPPSGPTATRPASSPPASSPVADALYQGPQTQKIGLNPATPESIAAGRKALDRRGFKYTETDAPIDEGRAAGSFEPSTGDITVSKNNLYDTTHQHEGMHGQLQSLMLSKNPRERQFAIDLIAAHGEEPLAELGARASIEGGKENRFMRLVKDNWNWLRTTKLGGGDATPERAARLLAESFDFDAPGAVPTMAGDTRFQGGIANGRYETEAERFLAKGAPGLQRGRDGTIDPGALKAWLGKQTKAEQELLKDVPFTKATPEDLLALVKEHGPKVEVVTYGMDGKVSAAKREYDAMTHDWYDRLSNNQKNAFIDAQGRAGLTVDPARLKSVGWADGDIAQANKYLDLATTARHEPKDASPRATSAYSKISAFNTGEPMPDWTATKGGKNVQRVDVVIPQKEVVKMLDSRDAYTGEQHRQTSVEPRLWEPDGTHEQLPNTLGWAMLQYKTGPRGEKIAVIPELQARWAQEKRKYLDAIKAGKTPEEAGLGLQYRPSMDHALADNPYRLILKAAIDKAREEGATHIMLSDAKSALMSEVLDTQYMGIGKHWTKENAETFLTPQLKDNGYKVYEHGGDYYLSKHQGGFDFNYDVSMPKIAEEFTGSKGERVSLGEHKNAMEKYKNTDEDQYALANATSEERATYRQEQTSRPRSNLIFRNPDGTPKTDVSGRMYALAPEGTKFQAVTDKYEPVPNSVFAAADALYPGVGARLAAYEGTKAKHYGLFNSALGELQDHGKIADSVALKMQEAHATGRAPALTPEEIPVYDRLTKLMQESAATATAAGRPVTPQANYFPHMPAVSEVRAYEKNPDAYLSAKLPEFADWNLKNYGPARGATPAEAEQYLKDYMSGASKAPDSQGSDFGALNKSARQFGLPPSMREPSALNALHRYGTRYSVELAKKQEILDHPDIANALGLGDTKVPVADTQAMKDAALHVNNALGQSGENPAGRDTKDVLNAGRQLVHSATMQTATALNNQVNFAQSMVHMDKPAHYVQFIKDTVRAVTDYQEQYAKTLAMSVNKPGVDPSANVSDLAGQVSTKLRGAANDLRRMTFGQFFENVSRVRNYTVAEGRARMDLALAATGDKSAQRFLDKFGAGVDTKQPFEEQVARVAKNYVDSMEGTYSGAGLPASVVNGGARSQLLRIQRYPLEAMARAYQYTIHPIQKDNNYGPLLAYLFGTALNYTALSKIKQALQGGVSGLVSEDEAKAAGANPQKEMLLNLMDMAGTANLFGFAGNAAQAVSKNLRGQAQPIFGDPTVNYMVTTYKNVLAAVDAVRKGEPVVPSLLEAGRRIILEQMQMTRGLGEDKDQKGDKALKAKHAYLTDRKDRSAVEIGGGLLTGNTFNYQVPQISPTRDKAIAGDRQAFLAQPPAKRRSLDNYPGGYESTADQANLETWLAASHPERLADYIHRRQAFKDRVHGREQGGQR